MISIPILVFQKKGQLSIKSLALPNYLKENQKEKKFAQLVGIKASTCWL